MIYDFVNPVIQGTVDNVSVYVTELLSASRSKLCGGGVTC